MGIKARRPLEPRGPLLYGLLAVVSVTFPGWLHPGKLLGLQVWPSVEGQAPETTAKMSVRCRSGHTEGDRLNDGLQLVHGFQISLEVNARDERLDRIAHDQILIH